MSIIHPGYERFYPELHEAVDLTFPNIRREYTLVLTFFPLPFTSSSNMNALKNVLSPLATNTGALQDTLVRSLNGMQFKLVLIALIS